MTEEKFGIDNLKSVLVFGVTVGKTIAEDVADKKFTFTEIMALLPQLMKIPDLVAQKDAIVAEAKDLTIDEIRELVAVVEGVINNEDVVATIEDVISIGVAIKNLIGRFKPKTVAESGSIAADGTIVP